MPQLPGARERVPRRESGPAVDLRWTWERGSGERAAPLGLAWWPEDDRRGVERGIVCCPHEAVAALAVADLPAHGIRMPPGLPRADRDVTDHGRTSLTALVGFR